MRSQGSRLCPCNAVPSPHSLEPCDHLHSAMGGEREHEEDTAPIRYLGLKVTHTTHGQGNQRQGDCYMQSLLGSHFQGVHTLEGRTQILRDSEPHLLRAHTYRDEMHKANDSQVPSQPTGQCPKFYSVLFRLGL